MFELVLLWSFYESLWMFLYMTLSVHIDTFLLGVNLEVELLDHWVCLCLAFQSSGTILFYIRISSYGNSGCFTSKEVIFNYRKKLGDSYSIHIMFIYKALYGSIAAGVRACSFPLVITCFQSHLCLILALRLEPITQSKFEFPYQ